MFLSKPIVFDRIHAAQLLGQKLVEFTGSDAIVVAIPNGGVPVGYHLSRILHLPLEIMPCKRIPHPAYKSKSLGSVCGNEVCIHDTIDSIPQDYISFQIESLKKSNTNLEKYLYNKSRRESLCDRTVILVKDVIENEDDIMGSIASIRNEGALKIVLTVPAILNKAVLKVSQETDWAIFLNKISDERGLTGFFSPVTDEDSRALLNSSKDKVLLSPYFSTLDRV